MTIRRSSAIQADFGAEREREEVGRDDREVGREDREVGRERGRDRRPAREMRGGGEGWGGEEGLWPSTRSIGESDSESERSERQSRAQRGFVSLCVEWSMEWGGDTGHWWGARGGEVERWRGGEGRGSWRLMCRKSESHKTFLGI